MNKTWKKDTMASLRIQLYVISFLGLRWNLVSYLRMRFHWSEAWWSGIEKNSKKWRFHWSGAILRFVPSARLHSLLDSVLWGSDPRVLFYLKVRSAPLALFPLMRSGDFQHCDSLIHCPLLSTRPAPLQWKRTLRRDRSRLCII